MKKKKVVLYVRFKRKDAVYKENSLQGQRQRLREFCAANNYEVVTCFEDNLTESNPNRRKWKELEQYVYLNKNDIDEVLMVCFSRLSTKINVVHKSMEQFKGISVDITCLPTQENNDMSRMELFSN